MVYNVCILGFPGPRKRPHILSRAVSYRAEQCNEQSGVILRQTTTLIITTSSDVILSEAKDLNRSTRTAIDFLSANCERALVSPVAALSERAGPRTAALGRNGGDPIPPVSRRRVTRD
jgi:hypothetical protein